MALHEQCVGATDEWYTPPHVFEALTTWFDVDVASPGKRTTPWIPARDFITANSLGRDWKGFVWMNPPFGGRNGLTPWLEKFFSHSNGIALVPDRTSAPWWQTYAPRSSAVLFVAPKIKFIDAYGKPGKSPAQGTCLLARGPRAVTALLWGVSNGLGSIMFPVSGAEITSGIKKSGGGVGANTRGSVRETVPVVHGRGSANTDHADNSLVYERLVCASLLKDHSAGVASSSPDPSHPRCQRNSGGD
jgi:hypothetical protein